MQCTEICAHFCDCLKCDTQDSYWHERFETEAVENSEVLLWPCELFGKLYGFLDDKAKVISCPVPTYNLRIFRLILIYFYIRRPAKYHFLSRDALPNTSLAITHKEQVNGCFPLHGI